MLKQLQFSYAPDFDAFEIFQNELDAARERLLNITRRLRLYKSGRDSRMAVFWKHMICAEEGAGNQWYKRRRSNRSQR